MYECGHNQTIGLRNGYIILLVLQLCFKKNRMQVQLEEVFSRNNRHSDMTKFNLLELILCGNNH